MVFCVPLENDQRIIENFNSKNVDAILNIFSEYAVFEKPTAANIRRLTIRVGKSALIKAPAFG